MHAPWTTTPPLKLECQNFQCSPWWFNFVKIMTFSFGCMSAHFSMNQKGGNIPVGIDCAVQDCSISTVLHGCARLWRYRSIALSRQYLRLNFKVNSLQLKHLHSERMSIEQYSMRFYILRINQHLLRYWGPNRMVDNSQSDFNWIGITQLPMNQFKELTKAKSHILRTIIRNFMIFVSK